MVKLLLLFILLLPNLSLSKELKISCFHYPPLTIDPKYGTPAGEGIVVDGLREFFKPHGVTLKIEWTTLPRAVKLVESGEKEGICALNPHRSNSLDYIEPRLVLAPVFIWAPKKSKYKYKGVTSLENKIVGNVRGFVYNDSSPSFQAYLERNEEKVFTVTGSNPVKRIFKLMEKGRIDLFAISSEYIYYRLGTEYVHNKFKKVGKLENELEAYFALNPKMKDKEEIQKIYQESFSSFKKGPKMLKIYKRYIK